MHKMKKKFYTETKKLVNIRFRSSILITVEHLIDSDVMM